MIGIKDKVVTATIDLRKDGLDWKEPPLSFLASSKKDILKQIEFELR